MTRAVQGGASFCGGGREERRAGHREAVLLAGVIKAESEVVARLASSCRDMASAASRRDAREVERITLLQEGLVSHLRDLEDKRERLATVAKGVSEEAGEGLEPPELREALQQLKIAAEQLRRAVEVSRRLLEFSLEHTRACLRLLEPVARDVRVYDRRA